MDKFIDLGVSVFDPDFTLNPYPYLKDLYQRDDILGFRSESLNFLFRFDDCRQVIMSKTCARAIATAKQQELEIAYTERYPHRARHYQLSYMNLPEGPDLKFKALVMRFIADVAEQASFTAVEPVFQKLAGGQPLDNYIDDIAKIPMRIFLDCCGLTYSDSELDDLHRSGCDFLKSLENFLDEELIRKADTALQVIGAYVEGHWDHLPKDSLLYHFIAQGREAGISDAMLQVNIIGVFITSISNTIGISSAFILKHLIEDSAVRRQLQDNPGLLDNDNVIMELLRRDNHVKALSRQAHQPLSLRGFTIEQGESFLLLFPGINLDPGHWHNPLSIDFSRDFSGENNIIFGGSMFTCIGKKLALVFLKHMTLGFIKYLPDQVSIDETQIEMDGGWLAERIITRMPIRV